MTKRTEFETKALEQLTVKVRAADARRNNQWVRLDSQAKLLLGRLQAAKAAGNAKQLDLVRRALAQIMDAMRKHIDADGAGGDPGEQPADRPRAPRKP